VQSPLNEDIVTGKEIKIVVRSSNYVVCFGKESLTIWKFYKKELISLYKEM
jgi:hypothetical protein